MGFMGTFVSGAAAAFQGQELIANLDEKKAQTDEMKANAQLKQMDVLQSQQKIAGQQDVAAWMKANATSDAQQGKDGVAQLAEMQKGAQGMLAKGDMAGYEMMTGLAKTKASELKEMHVAQQQDKAEKMETVAQAAAQYSSNPTPQGGEAIVKAAVAAGIDPMTIPPPGSLKFSAFAKDLQTASMSAKDRVEWEDKKLDRDRAFKEKQDEHKDHEQDLAATRALTASNQAAMQASRAESQAFREEMAVEHRDDRKSALSKATDEKDRAMGDKITRETQALPVVKNALMDRSVTENILALEADGGSPLKDKELHQLLTTMHAGTGRATNLYYKDTANFGTTDEKVAGFLSQTFTGRYSDEQRRQAFELAHTMQDKVIDPSLKRMEDDAKARAVKYKIDPDLVEIAGPWNRNGVKSSRESDRAVGGRLDESGKAEAPKIANKPQYTEGQQAHGPNGQVLTYKNGEWK